MSGGHPRSEKQRAALAKWNTSPENHAHLARLNIWTPEHRAKHSVAIKAHPRSAKQKAWIARLGARPRIPGTPRTPWISKTSKTPKQREAAREHIIRLNSIPWTPERRAKMSAAIKARPRSCEQIAHITRINADPIVCAKKVHTQNPSHDELKLSEYLPPGFVHTGQNPEERVAGRWPDYKDEGRRLIVEYDGHYKHYATQEGKDNDNKRDCLLAEAGYRVLHLYPWDMKDKDALRMKIDAFVEGLE